MNGWQFEVQAYYREGGGLAFITRHSSEVSKQIEVQAAQSRPEIGRVVVRDLRLSRGPGEVYG